MTGVRAYMSGKLKVRGDLMLAQRLEEVFNKTGGQEVSIFMTVFGGGHCHIALMAYQRTIKI
jgi:hypothetical protein